MFSGELNVDFIFYIISGALGATFFWILIKENAYEKVIVVH